MLFFKNKKDNMLTKKVSIILLFSLATFVAKEARGAVTTKDLIEITQEFRSVIANSAQDSPYRKMHL